ncbi:iron-siderophore ABC transporter substrate-binding protein [Actinacidiphila sp. DG2A-62]|uniref:iron-siderophore ABC transporter substrate-binding protein n=1 Tax=Actinacidiphila sp. DG2A-62 TaxID=3108821 RepID=UPI002DBF3BCD|nr:iron-siderophore ABC transporter substrate-binding protein [Actinacidiphila sp. DG2A-62]MEC3995447.1 iron-siderophore ABC transporter substrate-binding protein [Actinacidiphila sp. DG2A-62]
MRRLTATTAAATATALAALCLAACGTTHSAADAADAAGDEAPSAGSSAQGGTGKAAGPVTLTDASGTRVHLDAPATRVVGTEWNVVEDLVTLGVDPVGVADVKGYTAWDTAAPLRSSAKDIGTRGEPSMDTVAALAPDLVVATTDLSASAVAQLRKIAPVVEVRSADAADQIGLMTTDLDLIAKATGTERKAAAVKQAFDAKLASGRKALADAGLAGAPYAFADGYVQANQVAVRPYTSGSLIGAVNERIGLKNAWKVAGDKAYGLATTDVEGLTGLGDVRFAYIANDADGDPFTTALAKNAVWRSLPFVAAGHVSRLPDGVWMFGGPASMGAYVDSVVAALTKSPAK